MSIIGYGCPHLFWICHLTAMLSPTFNWTGVEVWTGHSACQEYGVETSKYTFTSSE